MPHNKHRRKNICSSTLKCKELLHAAKDTVKNTVLPVAAGIATSTYICELWHKYTGLGKELSRYPAPELLPLLYESSTALNIVNHFVSKSNMPGSAKIALSTAAGALTPMAIELLIHAIHLQTSQTKHTDYQHLQTMIFLLSLALIPMTLSMSLGGLAVQTGINQMNNDKQDMDSNQNKPRR